MMITEIEDFFTLGCGRCEHFATPQCTTRLWIEGITTLRAICTGMGLVETVKWAHPCYMHAGRNIALIGSLRSDHRLIFFNPALLKDPQGVLERQGPNTQYPDMIRFTDNSRATALADTIRAYLSEAMAYAEAGILPQRQAREIEMPDELIDALDSDPELAEAFHALTPGRQKSYLFNLNSAKTSATRLARIEKFRPLILAGKGALER